MRRSPLIVPDRVMFIHDGGGWPKRRPDGRPVGDGDCFVLSTTGEFPLGGFERVPDRPAGGMSGWKSIIPGHESYEFTQALRELDRDIYERWVKEALRF